MDFYQLSKNSFASGVSVQSRINNQWAIILRSHKMQLRSLLKLPQVPLLHLLPAAVPVAVSALSHATNADSIKAKITLILSCFIYFSHKSHILSVKFYNKKTAAVIIQQPFLFVTIF